MHRKEGEAPTREKNNSREFSLQTQPHTRTKPGSSQGPNSQTQAKVLSALHWRNQKPNSYSTNAWHYIEEPPRQDEARLYISI